MDVDLWADMTQKSTESTESTESTAKAHGDGDSPFPSSML